MQLPILCYHKVGPITEEGRRLNIEPRRLHAHVRFFSRRGFRFLLPRELAASWPERGVCLTFDDAYASALRYGCEAVASAGGIGAFYAVPALVGKSSVWDGDLARPLADWDALRRAQELGFEIGNHTNTHPRLGGLSEVEQLEELKAAHHALTSEGIESKTVCYPYGSIGPATARLASLLGYQVGLALGRRRARPSDPKMTLPRIVLAYSDGLPMLLYKLHLLHLLPKRKRGKNLPDLENVGNEVSSTDASGS
jgi:peptidoglycan/xylan/chitin deacetylase (PgdA/CDA1 family)